LTANNRLQSAVRKIPIPIDTTNKIPEDYRENKRKLAERKKEKLQNSERKEKKNYGIICNGVTKIFTAFMLS
jgi:hypothetical protein